MITLTSTSRLARELGQEFDREQADKGLRAWPTRRFVAFSDWVLEAWTGWLYSGSSRDPWRVLSAAQEYMLWEDIVRSDAEQLPLGLPRTAELAAEAWKDHCEWRVPLDSLQWQRSEETRTFRRWVWEFQRRCKGNKWLSRSELAAKVADLVEKNQISGIPASIDLVGFLDLKPAQERLRDALVQSGVNVSEASMPGFEENAERMCYLDAKHEIRAVAEWARQTLEHDPEAAEPDFRIGVVVPQLEQMRSLISGVFGEVLHPEAWKKTDPHQARRFNISLGLPLATYPVIKAAFHILDTDPPRIPIDHLGRLLRSPFLPGADKELTARALLDCELRSIGAVHLSLDRVMRKASAERKPYACPALLRALEAWQRHYKSFKAERLPSEWAEALARALYAVDWPGSRSPSSSERQTEEAWNEHIQELFGFDGLTGRVSLQRAVSLLKRIVSDKKFQPKSDAAPVQILGAYEATGLRFNRLWIVGMHDGVWPLSSGPSPLLPLQLQRDRKVPQSAPEHELDHATKLTRHLLSRAPKVFVSFPERDGDVDLRVSPLFARLPSGEAWGTSESYLSQLQQSGSLETVEDHRGPSVSEAVLRGGTSLIKLQAACPFKAFATYRLGATVPIKPEPGLNAMERGTLVHRVLEAVWGKLKNHEQLDKLSKECTTQMVAETADAKIQALAKRCQALRNPRFADTEHKRITKLVSAWLSYEKDRQPFSVHGLEVQKTVTVGGIEMRVRIDRVDRLDDGSLVILDYKTGQCAVGAWDGERPDEPQLPIYVITTSERISGVFFGSLKADDIKFIGLADDPSIAPGNAISKNSPKPSEQRKNWLPVLEALAQDFLAGRAEVDPKKPKQTCRYCDLPALCRISSRQEHGDA